MTFNPAKQRLRLAGLVLLSLTVAAGAAEVARYDYRVLATTRTSTMEKEMNEAADAGYQLMAVMGGETGVGGKEVVVVMGKPLGSEPASRKKYKLLATSRTSTMQKEMREVGQAGLKLLGLTVAKTAFGGSEVVSILGKETP